jgi:hypothetical protein
MASLPSGTRSGSWCYSAYGLIIILVSCLCLKGSVHRQIASLAQSGRRYGRKIYLISVFDFYENNRFRHFIPYRHDESFFFRGFQKFSRILQHRCFFQIQNGNKVFQEHNDVSADMNEHKSPPYQTIPPCPSSGFVNIMAYSRPVSRKNRTKSFLPASTDIGKQS